ncbi:MAG: hypothetical protein R2769_01565 [Saprospiraceae bacterium]
MAAIFNILDPLMEFKPPFVDVTTIGKSLFIRKGIVVIMKKSPSANVRHVGICASIMHRYGIDAVPHLICGGFTKEETGKCSD